MTHLIGRELASTLQAKRLPRSGGTVPPRWIKNGGNTAQLENFIQTSGLYDVIAREWYGLMGGVSTP